MELHLLRYYRFYVANLHWNLTLITWLCSGYDKCVPIILCRVSINLLSQMLIVYNVYRNIGAADILRFYSSGSFQVHNQFALRHGTVIERTRLVVSNVRLFYRSIIFMQLHFAVNVVV